MKYYIGIDASLTGTGICLMDDDHMIATHLRVDPKARRGCERLEFILTSFRDVLHKFQGIEAAAIEGYAYGARGHLAQLGELGGLLRLELYCLDIPFTVVAATSLKKYVTGSGRGDKNMMLLSVYKKWGISCADDDQADSYALARLCCAIHEKEELLKYEQEVVANILKKG